MGGFALCIENATRDIHSLLTLHRVHPQVHADVQRILGSLLRRQYTDMSIHNSSDIADSPAQVCRAVVESIIDQTVNTAIPATETKALERRCAVLEEEKDLLETEAVKSEAQLADVQTVLRNLKDAHDYMLHSYFREALTLRSRIDNLQRQNRAYRLHASAAASTASAAGIAHSSTVGAQLQQFVFNTANSSPSSSQGMREGAVSKRLGADEVLGGEAAAAAGAASGDASVVTPSSTSFKLNAKQDRTAPVSQDTSPTRGLSETRRGHPPGEVQASDSGGGNQQAHSPVENAPPPPSSRGGTPSPGGKDRSVRIAPPFNTSSPARQMMTMQTTATYELVPAGDPESVDAIFDYEEYVRILNGKRGSWSKRYVAVMAEPDGGARRRRRSLKYRTRSYSDVLLRGSDGEIVPGDVNASQHEGQQLQDAKMKGYRWLLHLALEPVQHKLKAELLQLRQAVCTMQKEHARDVQAISRALLHVQSRNDGLLDFLDTFVQETKRTIAVLARDSRAHTITDLLSSGALPAERADTIGTFFTPTPSPSLAALSSGTSPAPPPPLTLVAEMVGATAGTAAGGSSGGGGSGGPPRAVSPHALHPRKEWRLKPDVRLDAETRSAAMRAMDRRLQRPDISKAPPISNTPPEEGNTAQYYRADLGLPYWNAHPITHHAQEIFGELQHVAKEMRVTRVQQLYAYEEAVALRGDGGRRVRFGKRNGSTASPSTEWRSTPSQRTRTGSQNVAAEKKGDSFYGPEDDADGTRPRKLLKDGWRNKTVVEGDGATGGDLLLELVHLRMRRACDQVRLARVQDTILHTFHPELAAQEDDPMAMLARRDQAGHAGRRWSFTDMPPIAFTSPEEVLKHRALQQVRTNAQKRIATTSQRIAELQRLLAMHFAEHEVQEVVDLSTVEAARRTAAEEAQGLYRVNGELRSTADLWNSPYLNDGRRVLYLPIGLDSTRDAEGNVSGGAGACVMLGDTPISMAPYRGTATTNGNTDRSYGVDLLRRQTTRSGEDETDTAAEANVEPRNSPFVAVMEYCRGVQLGRPVGRRGGPVFLLQDAETGEYYVGDAEGRPLGTAASEEQGGAELAAAAETWRPPLSMTRILFPAPLPAENTAEAAAAAASGDAVGEVANGPVPQLSNAATALRPLYLVPMAVPLSDEEAVIRQGWQACHRHGHTRHDPIFSTDLSPLPLSASYHSVVPQRREGGGHDVAVGVAGVASNRYVSDPPRVFQPADEAAAMVRVRALRLQTRSASDAFTWEASEVIGGGAAGAGAKGQPPTGAAGAGAPSVLSDSTNNGVTASPAETAAATTPPTSLRPLEPLRGSPTAATTAPYDAARSSSAKLGGAAAAGGGWEAPPTSTSLSASAPGKMKGSRGAGTASLAATTPAPGSASAMTAAVLVAKQQRAARLAQEAEAANHVKVQRQEAWQQRGETRVPTEKEAFLRLPHLSPLPAHSSETSALLPSAASSARLQRQMRPEKYALSPPPPASSRRSESAKRGSSEWNLDGDA